MFNKTPTALLGPYILFKSLLHTQTIKAGIISETKVKKRDKYYE